VIELAEALSKKKARQRTIIFACFGSEETLWAPMQLRTPRGRAHLNVTHPAGVRPVNEDNVEAIETTARARRDEGEE
jgi:hypothetical protein